MAESTKEDITKVEYFGMREISWYILAALLMGIIVGSSIAFYKDYRFREINHSINELEADYLNFEEAREEIDSDLDKDVQTLIEGMINLQSFSKCHENSTQGQLFPDSVKFEKKPLYMVSQSRILLELHRAEKVGTWTAPEDPVKVIQNGDNWSSYDVVMPKDSKSKMCVFFFENNPTQKVQP
jgi:uncharacterized membrane-anchored protein YhcB (DUF1043 family)